MNTLINTDNGDTIYLLPLLKHLHNKYGKSGIYFPKSSPYATTHYTQKLELFYDLLFEQQYITSFGFVDIDFDDQSVFCSEKHNTIRISQVFFDKFSDCHKLKTNICNDKEVTNGFIFNHTGVFIDFIPNFYWPHDKNINLYPLCYLIVERFGYGKEFLKPWLHLKDHQPLHDRPIAISRTHRYTENPKLMQTLIKKLGKNNFIFLGLESEYQKFSKDVEKKIDFLYTKNLLEAAKALNTVNLYIGNQSCLLAIAESLKINTICEGCKRVPNCNFSFFRDNFWYGFTDNSENLYFVNNTQVADQYTIMDISLKREKNFVYRLLP